MREGPGTQSYPDGSSFTGVWHKDEKVETGAWTDGPTGVACVGGHLLRRVYPARRAHDGGRFVRRYEGEYAEGVHHGEAKWVGVYGDRYQGTFGKGDMNGVGKFNFANGVYEGEEYLGCWLAPGGAGQMARRMSSLKKATVDDMLAAMAKAEADKRERELHKGNKLSGIPLEDMPHAVQALRAGLLRGGLDEHGASTGGAGAGARRAAGSMTQRKMGAKLDSPSASKGLASLSAAGSATNNRSTSTRLLAGVASGVNPLNEAESRGGVFHPSTSRAHEPGRVFEAQPHPSQRMDGMQLGPPASRPPGMPGSALGSSRGSSRPASASIKSGVDLSTRFAGVASPRASLAGSASSRT